MKKFLVVVDTQYDFVMPGGALYVKDAEQIIVPGIEFLANLKPEEYEGVLKTFDTHVPDAYEGSPESELFPIHCVEGTPGWENVFNKHLINSDIKVWEMTKGVFNMWEEDYLPLFREGRQGDASQNEFSYRDEFFERLKDDGIDTIQVFGVASDFCVKWAVDGFVKRGFKVEVIEHLCRGINETAGEVFTKPEYDNVRLI